MCTHCTEIPLQKYTVGFVLLTLDFIRVVLLYILHAVLCDVTLLRK